MKFDFNAFRKTVEDVGGQARALRADLERLKRQRDDLHAAPASKSDLKAAAKQFLSGLQTEFARVVRAQLDPFVRAPHKLADVETLKGRMVLLGATGKPDAIATPRTMDVVLAGLLGPAITTAYLAEIDAMDFEEGPTNAERAKRLELLDEAIAAAQTQLDDLTSTARGAGIVLEV